MPQETEAPGRYVIEVTVFGVSGWVEKFTKVSDAAERAKAIAIDAFSEGNVPMEVVYRIEI